jgi:hypothetical protein
VAHHKKKTRLRVVVRPHAAVAHPGQSPLPQAPAPLAAVSAPTPTSSYYWIFLAAGGLLVAAATGVALASSGIRRRR